MASDPTNLFDSVFTITKIDPDGKKFDRVSRIEAYSASSDMKLSIDIATEIYPIAHRKTFTLQLAYTLQPESDSTNAEEGDAAKIEPWRIDVPGNEGISEGFDYVMHGKIYKFDEGMEDTITVYGSFGGLLMALTGSYRHLQSISIGKNVYLLIR